MLSKWRFDRALHTLAKSEHGVLRDYAHAQWPARDCRLDEARLLALDFELDGLRKDAHILQAGWVAFEGSSIALAKAQSFDIRSTIRLDDKAVTIHGIGQQRAADGDKIANVFAQLITALSGRVIIAHCASIERDALQRVAKALFGIYLPVRSICTLNLERKLNANLVGQEAYRLGPCRARYGLPDYSAHDALTDAIAAAELFQAQIKHMPPTMTLGNVETA